jgi:NAD(P)-dependent dehydrogenase (short-subunit alcohol dehydrogenase family)
MGQLEGKVAVVTGGSAGIGLATAQRFAEEGAHVYLCGRRKTELDEAVAQVGHGAVGVQADVARAEDMERLYTAVSEQGHRVDVIFANAALAGYTRLEDITDDHFDRVVAVNMKGPLYTVQKALPLLNDGASIILVTSVSNTQGMEGLSVYAATKAGLRSFTRTWANELKGRNIRVNALSPGSTETPAVVNALGGEEAKGKWMREKAAGVPLGRVATSDNQASVALFLASDQSAYMTGTELVVDGGFTQI